jgi:hypothetical protein
MAKPARYLCIERVNGNQNMSSIIRKGNTCDKMDGIRRVLYSPAREANVRIIPDFYDFLPQPGCGVFQSCFGS